MDAIEPTDSRRDSLWWRDVIFVGMSLVEVQN